METVLSNYKYNLTVKEIGIKLPLNRYEHKDNIVSLYCNKESYLTQCPTYPCPDSRSAPRLNIVGLGMRFDKMSARFSFDATHFNTISLFPIDSVM